MSHIPLPPKRLTQDQIETLEEIVELVRGVSPKVALAGSTRYELGVDAGTLAAQLQSQRPSVSIVWELLTGMNEKLATSPDQTAALMRTGIRAAMEDIWK